MRGHGDYWMSTPMGSSSASHRSSADFSATEVMSSHSSTNLPSGRLAFTSSSNFGHRRIYFRLPRFDNLYVGPSYATPPVYIATLGQGREKKGMAEVQTQQFSVEKPSTGQELVVSMRWRRIKAGFNCGIILLSVVQIALGCVQTVEDAEWEQFWLHIGPVVSRVIDPGGNDGTVCK